jgi:hypothetical protein
MAITGPVDRPTRLIVDAAAVANAATVEGQVRCDGFTKALVRIVANQTHTVVFKGNADAAATAYGDLYNGVTQMTKSDATASTAGQNYLLDVTGLGVLDVFIANNSGSTATVSVWVTLAN